MAGLTQHVGHRLAGLAMIVDHQHVAGIGGKILVGSHDHAAASRPELK